MDTVDDAVFDAAVQDGLALVPEELMRLADNVAIFVEDEPTAEHADPSLSDEENAELLGVYLGTPLTERDGWWAAGSLPKTVAASMSPRKSRTHWPSLRSMAG